MLSVATGLRPLLQVASLRWKVYRSPFPLTSQFSARSPIIAVGLTGLYYTSWLNQGLDEEVRVQAAALVCLPESGVSDSHHEEDALVVKAGTEVFRRLPLPGFHLNRYGGGNDHYHPHHLFFNNLL